MGGHFDLVVSLPLLGISTSMLPVRHGACIYVSRFPFFLYFWYTCSRVCMMMTVILLCQFAWCLCTGLAWARSTVHSSPMSLRYLVGGCLVLVMYDIAKLEENRFFCCAKFILVVSGRSTCTEKKVDLDRPLLSKLSRTEDDLDFTLAFTSSSYVSFFLRHGLRYRHITKSPSVSW